MTSIAKIQFSNNIGNSVTHCILGCKHFRVEINHDIDEPCTALMQAWKIGVEIQQGGRLERNLLKSNKFIIFTKANIIPVDYCICAFC